MTQPQHDPAARDGAMRALFERLAIAAGRTIMDVYRTAFHVERKADRSPVTEADRKAEALILEGLRAAFPEIACVAEEEMAAGLAPPALGSEFFLVDPLDGTREFVDGRPEFTVNIALVRDAAPAAGVVYAPASGRLFSAAGGRAEECAVSGDLCILARRPIMGGSANGPCRIAASRSHLTARTEAFIARYPKAEIVTVGSSLKFCLLACGEADLYPRFGPTMEWDTAAGDAVLRAAGGSTLDLAGTPLAYGKRNVPGRPDFLNPGFVAASRTWSSRTATAGWAD